MSEITLVARSIYMQSMPLVSNYIFHVLSSTVKHPAVNFCSFPEFNMTDVELICHLLFDQKLIVCIMGIYYSQNNSCSGSQCYQNVLLTSCKSEPYGGNQNWNEKHDADVMNATKNNFFLQSNQTNYNILKPNYLDKKKQPHRDFSLW